MDNLSIMDKIDKSEKKLESINQWISNCDTKSSFVLTFYGVVLTIIFTSDVGKSIINTFSFVKSNDIDWRSLVNFFLLTLSISFFVTSLNTFYHIYSTLKGRIDPNIYRQIGLNTDSNIFFGSIASKTFQNFESSSNNEDETKYLNDINSQVFINSNIVNEKFEHYNKSLFWMFISLAIFVMHVLIK